MLFITLITIFVIFLIVNYIKLLYFWRSKKVKYVTPMPFLGNFAPVLFQRDSITELIFKLYNSYSNERYVGVFQFEKPVLLIKDVELIKQITIKDFDSFVDHFNIFKEDVDPLWGKNLFASEGERWRDLRQTLSPVFTSSKMKSMFILMDDCAKKLIEHIKSKNEEVIEYEAKEFFSKFTTDVIGTTAFGIECNSFRNDVFLSKGKILTDLTGIKKLKMFLAGVHPLILKTFNIKMVGDDVGDFFRKIISETLEVREKNNIIRPDLLHLLMEARKGKLKYEEESDVNSAFSETKEYKIEKTKTVKKIEISDEDITAQALVFFFGGYDTVSTLMVFMMYELCANPDIQEKLRQEMLESLKTSHNTVNYEAIQQMKYLDMVVSETLRKWPNAILLDRLCTKTYTIEPKNAEEREVILEKGTSIWVPTFGIHRDPKYYENPEKFDPERFNEENKCKIEPQTYLPFGSGPRNCIGSRFALLETKNLFFHLLTNFEIVPTNKTRIPVRISKNHLNLHPEGGFWFGFKNLKR